MQKATFFNSKDGDRKYNAADWANYFKPLFVSGVFNGDLFVSAGTGMQVVVATGYAWLEGYGYNNTEDLVIDLEVASGNLNRYDAIKVKLDLSARTITAYADKGGNAAAPTQPTNERSDTVFEITLAEIYIAAGTTQITQSMITDTRMISSKCGWVTGSVNQIDFTKVDAQFKQFFKEKIAQIEADVTEFEDGIDERNVDADNYLEQYKQDVDGNKTQADEFLETFKQYLQNYTSQHQAEFEAWVETIKGILGEEAAGELLLMIEDLQGRVTTLEDMLYSGTILADLTTSDGDTIVTDSGDVISARWTLAIK